MIAMDTLLKMTMTESFATQASHSSLQSLDQMNALFIWELSKILFTFFTNGICCFTTTSFKNISRTAWNFSNKQSLQYNNLLLLTLYKTGIGNVTLIGVVHYIKENITH